MNGPKENAEFDNGVALGGPLAEHVSSTYPAIPTKPANGSLMPSHGVPGSAPSVEVSLSMLLRRKWMILGVFVLVAGILIPAIWLFTVPKYRATAVVRVAPSVPRLLYKYEDNGLVPLYQSFLQTQVAIIRNPVVLRRVLDEREVQQTSWYQASPGGLFKSPAPPLARLRKGISVSPRRGTELIDVSMTADDPHDAQIIVDRVVRQYKNYVDTLDDKVDQMQMVNLTGTQADLRNEIEGKIRTKNILEQKLGTAEPGEIRSQVAERLVQLRQNLDDLMLEQELNEWRLEYLAKSLKEAQRAPTAEGEGGAETTVAADHRAARYEDDALWRDRMMAREEARHMLGVARNHFGEEHPTIKQRLARLEHTESLLRKRQAELDDPRSVPIPVDGGGSMAEVAIYDQGFLDRAIAEAQFRREQLEKAIVDQRREVYDVNQKAQTIERLDEEILQKRERAGEVRRRLTVLRTERKASKELGRISIAADAVLPYGPHRDRRILLSILALGAAMAAGIGAAFVRTKLDPSVRGACDVRASVHIPFLGYLPKVRFESELLGEPSEGLYESMRMVRTALLDRVSAGVGCSVVITSPGPRAGKTTVAILLAKSLARVGKKVLLVDADLRHPSIPQRMGISSEFGLADLLSGRVGQEEAVVASGVERVDVLPAGVLAEEKDPELMANGVFSRCLEEWKKVYDFVVFDSPPVLPVADARILASQVDGTILTLRSSHCRRADAVEAVEQISAAGGRTVGTILVGAERESAYPGSGGGYYT